MRLDPDFAELLGLLHAAHGVRFLVVGGYAVAVHGHPRYTGDLDVWLFVDAENAARVMAALRDVDESRRLRESGCGSVSCRHARARGQ